MFKIDNVEKFAKDMISVVFDDIKSKLSETLNEKEDKLNPTDFVAVSEAILIVEYIISKYNRNNYKKVSDKLAALVCQDIHNRFFSNCLHQMTNGGYLDCAFCDQENAFIFQLTEKGKKMGMKILSNLN